MEIVNAGVRMIINLIKFVINTIIGNHVGFCLRNNSSISASFRACGENAKIILGKRLRVENNSRISTVGGIIKLGDSVFINRNCIIVSRYKISVGARTLIGPGCYIYDHDHDYRGDGYISKEIIVGENVWIGANCVILKGVTIGDNSVIAAGTVVTGDVPADTLVYNERSLKMKSVKR